MPELKGNFGSQLLVFLRRHWVALAFTLIISLLYGLPHFFMARTLHRAGESYYPMLLNVDETFFTGAKVNSVFLGTTIRGDINLWEAKDTPTPFLLPPLSHLMAGYLAKLLGSVSRAFIALDFLFPPLTFFLFYLIGYELFLKKTFSLFFASFASFIPRFFAFFPLVTRYYQAFLVHQLFDVPGRLYFDRFEDPEVTLPFLLLSLYLIFRSLRRRERFTPYLAGISFGVLFYSYFYYAAYLSVALGFAFLFFFFKKQKQTAWLIFKIILIGLGVSLFYWINFFRLVTLPNYHDIAARLGPERGHHLYLSLTPIFSYFQHTLLALFLFLLLRKRLPDYAVWFVALLLPVFVIYNFQIITGFNPQPDHWVKPRQVILVISFFLLFFLLINNHQGFFKKKIFYYLIPLFAFLLLLKGFLTESFFVKMVAFGSILGVLFLYLSYRFIKGRERGAGRYGNVIFFSLACLLFLRGGATQFTLIKERTPEATLTPAESASFAWLNDRTPPSSVVGSPSFLTNTYLQLLTHAKLFTPFGNHTFASDEEILRRFYFLNAYLRVSEQTFGSYFATEKSYPPHDWDHEGISYLFIDEYRAATPGSIFTPQGQQYPLWNETFHQEVVNGYEPYLASTSLQLPYRLDYIYYGPRERVFASDPILTQPKLTKVYDEDGIIIYKR